MKSRQLQNKIGYQTIEPKRMMSDQTAYTYQFLLWRHQSCDRNRKETIKLGKTKQKGTSLKLLSRWKGQEIITKKSRARDALQIYHALRSQFGSRYPKCRQLILGARTRN
jgi:hypothetical protein